MEIFYKCAPYPDELDSSRGLNADGMELQLLNKFTANYKGTAEYLELLSEDISVIKFIHSPLKFGQYKRDAINIEDLQDSFAIEVLQNVCDLAEEIGKINNSQIGVIVHTGINMVDLNLNLNLRTYLLSQFGYLLTRYPHVNLYIENVICTSTREKEALYFTNGALPNYIDIINFFRKQLNKPERIYGVLDICHAFSTVRMLRGCGSFYDLDDFFKRMNNNNAIGLIHLAYLDNLGIQTGEHAIGYTEETYPELKYVMSLYNRYGFTCPITIEVNEQDYSQYNVYKETRKLLGRIIER